MVSFYRLTIIKRYYKKGYKHTQLNRRGPKENGIVQDIEDQLVV